MENNLVLKSIDVQYFKSIKQIHFDVPDFAVLVGKNASGKTNIVNVFRFLRDVAEKGFREAVQKQGGKDILFNSVADKSESIVAKANLYYNEDKFFRLLEPNIKWYHGSPDIAGMIHSTQHYNTIRREGESSWSVVENINAKGVLHELDIFTPFEQSKLIVQSTKRQHWGGEQVIAAIGRERNLYYGLFPRREQSEIAIPSEITPPNINEYQTKEYLNGKTLLDIEPHWGRDIKDVYSSIRIYDFIPKQIKENTSTSGNYTLDEDGGNLNIVLERILSNQEDRRQFLNLVSYALPFVQDVKTESIRQGHISASLVESYNEKFPLPAEFFSDGTATVIAMIVALFFEESSVCIIEEPERFVHPAIMDKLATLFEDASRHKKVIITTHSPDLVRHVPQESVFLVARDEQGFTTLRQANQDEDIKDMLNKELGMDELLSNNFFEG